MSHFFLSLLVITLLTGGGEGAKQARANRGNPQEVESTYHRQEVPGSRFRAEQNVDPALEKDIDVQTGECSDEDRDCMGECFGTSVYDQCGTCGGNNEACKGCDGVPNSGFRVDCFGVCGGTAKRDCEGVCGGMAVRDTAGTCCSRTRVDDCGVCYGNNACTDCNGDLDGNALIDDCGVCSGGETGAISNSAKDCSGTCYGSARLDECQVCSGGTTTHLKNADQDCDGVCFGASTPDVCGVCKGDGTSCQGCDEVANSGKRLDVCGVCGGDNSNCCGPYGACNNVGECDAEEGGCVCYFGWTGKECTRRQDYCHWQDCGTHGSCNSENGGCICEQAYWGPQCQLSRCSGHGKPDVAGGKCICFDGYGGLDCSECTLPTEKNEVFVCLLKISQSVQNRVVDKVATRDMGSTVLEPLHFTMITAKKTEVDGLIGGWDTLTRSPERLAILPGSQYNGTTYGCNCQPDVPFEDIEHLFTKSTKNELKKNAEELEKGEGVKKRLDSQTISELSAKARLTLGDDFKISNRFVSHSYVRALTAIEASDFLNEVFDFFNVMEDAQTGTPETVGAAVDEVKEAALNEKILCIVYFILTVAIVLTVTIFALAVMFFFTGGRIGSRGASVDGSGELAEDIYRRRNRGW